ncbi:M15 family metallopeptidase [Agreia sp. COWG]|uniref:M15 family metallopeptidase n=1 Tax=Agreia sp. COWG TaxID=2773266 RepID=UPI0019269E67|nr:M15 family metallopeptidase [Agreia sp. COWG]CAD5999180.1 protein of unknown function [Agreia sp. COWG]
MTALKRHPEFWLAPNAAASFDRTEDDYIAAGGNQFDVASAGRTVGEQQDLIDRYDRGGTFNRPPYLYAPARPATASNHVRGGGLAADFGNATQRTWMHANGPKYGWFFNYAYDEVHFEYDRARDTQFGRADTPAATTGTEDSLMKISWDTSGTGYLRTENGIGPIGTMQLLNLFRRSIDIKEETFNPLEQQMMAGHISMIARSNLTGIALDQAKLTSALIDALSKQADPIAGRIIEGLKAAPLKFTSQATFTDADIAKVNAVLATAMNEAVPRISNAITKQAGAALSAAVK